MNEFKKMISGESYFPDDEYLLSLRNESVRKCREYNNEPEREKRNFLIKDMLSSGVECVIVPPIFLDYGLNTHLGNNVFINTNCIILDSAKVSIGDNTMLGPNVQIYTPEHPLDYKTRNSGFESAKPITVGKNCWLGGGVIILPGVTIGDGCVIGAGSVVTKNIPENSLAAGNPARVIRKIEQ